MRHLRLRPLRRLVLPGQRVQRNPEPPLSTGLIASFALLLLLLAAMKWLTVNFHFNPQRTGGGLNLLRGHRAIISFGHVSHGFAFGDIATRATGRRAAFRVGGTGAPP